jgi:hypothetical protein
MCKGKAKLKLRNWNIFKLRKEKGREAFRGKLVFVSAFVIPSTHSLTDRITRFNTPDLAPKHTKLPMDFHELC